ncbi:MAG: GNAT family N-acetyltransferase [Alcanivorax sp.]|nr:GNAT family N-acetyltransferase [Alcanivorax sp.]
MPETFTIEPFDRSKHDRSHFDCGVPSLNNYIQRQISNDIRRNLARGYAASPDSQTGTPRQLAGYYTLSTHSVQSALLPEDLGNCPYPEVPGVLIGRLAVSESFQGNGLGLQLIVSALRKSIELHDQVGIQLVVVDPLGEDVVGFYEKLGFREFGEGRLLLPIKTAKQARH